MIEVKIRKFTTTRKLIWIFILIPHHLTLSLMRAIQWTPGRGCWASGGGWIGWQASSGWALIRYPASPESGMASPNLQFTIYSSDTVSHRGQPYLAGKSSYILMGLKFVTFSTTTSLSIGLRLMWTRKHTVKDREFVIFVSCYVTENHILFSVIHDLSSFLKNKQ